MRPEATSALLLRRGGGSNALSSARGHQLSLLYGPPTVLVITSAVPNVWLRHTIIILVFFVLLIGVAILKPTKKCVFTRVFFW